MKFLCDEMLIRLGRWLRAAGYDTEIVSTKNSLSDREILEWAVRDKRLLITRDHHFIQMKEAKDVVIFLKANRLDECVKELSERIPINWLKAPFSRCLLCNHLLVTPDHAKLEQLPADIQTRKQIFTFCPNCDKIYWIGSHTHHMKSRLSQYH